MQLALRVVFVMALGIAYAAYAAAIREQREPEPSDFSQPWLAGRLLLDGKNPYQEIGPNGPVRHQFPLIYPLPAAVVAMPFTRLPARTADVVFVGAGAALLAWILTRKTLRNPQLLMFVSVPMLVAAQTVQWSPWFTAATALPSLGFVYAAKPSVATAYLIAYPSRAAFIGAFGITLLTVLIWPWWVHAWLSGLQAATHMSAPVVRFGGPLLLLALIRWRRPEARLLVALACVPQTPVAYEALPLFLLVRTIDEGLLLLVPAMLLPIVNPAGAGSYEQWMSTNGRWMIWLIYLPALLIILRRPNVGADDDLVCRLVNRLSALRLDRAGATQ